MCEQNQLNYDDKIWKLIKWKCENVLIKWITSIELDNLMEIGSKKLIWKVWSKNIRIICEKNLRELLQVKSKFMIIDIINEKILCFSMQKVKTKNWIINEFSDKISFSGKRVVLQYLGGLIFDKLNVGILFQGFNVFNDYNMRSGNNIGTRVR